MRLFICVSALICSEALLLGQSLAAEKAGIEGSALVVISGNDSRIAAVNNRRIESSSEWTETWLEHLGIKGDTIYRPTMEIDFKRCSVIAIFEGNTFNSMGYRVESVRESDKTVTVRFTSISFQTAGPDGGGVRVRPYAFVVLSKTKKPVVLEENVQSIKGEPPKWKEVSRLPFDD